MKHLAYLQSILDCTQDALFVTEPAREPGTSGRICYVNDAFTRLTGYTLTDAVRQPPTFQCGAATDFLMVRKLEAAFRRTEKSHLALLSYRKDGGSFRSEYFITPLIENDECTYVIAIQRPAAGEATAAANRDKLVQSLADALTESILIHHDKQPLFVNTAYVELFGYASRAEAMRELSPLMNLPLDADAAGTASRCNVLRTDGLSLTLTVRSHVICWDGSPATMLTINRDTRGAQAGGKKAAAARAMPAHKAAEEAALMRELLDSLPVILAHKTRDLRYTYVNKTYADWVDSTREQIIGSHVSNVRNESHYQLMKPRREEVLAGKVVQYNSTCEYPGRGMCDLLTTLIPQRDADGNVIGYFSMAQDITELKEVERTLARREEQLRLVMDSVPALISYRDRNLRYHYVNQPYAEWYGVRRENMIGRHMTEFVELAVIRDMKPLFDRVLAGERFRHTYRYDLRDASKRAMVVDYVPHEDENGHVAGFFALGQELSADDSRAMPESLSTKLRYSPAL
jgi:PAS domain S-box-containing protein